MKKTFTDKVKRIVSEIPKGKTLTYKQVAIKAGRPKAFRAVGSIMKRNYDPKVPCHRVIRNDGGMGWYNRGGVSRKMKLLAKEGVVFKKVV